MEEAGVGGAFGGAGGGAAGFPRGDGFAADREGPGDLVLAQARGFAEALALVRVRECVLRGGFFQQGVHRCEEDLLFVGHGYLRRQLM